PMDIMFIAQNELKLIDKELVSSVLPKRSAKSHKGNYGNLLNICGSNNMGGAAMMVTLSAMRMGVGKTTLASTKCVIDRCCGNMMEAMTISLPQNSNGEIQSESIAVLNKSLKQSTACLIGCGLGCSKNTREIVEYVIDNADCPIILDADALNVISQDLTILNNLKTPAVITPHIGEMARLSALTIEEVQKSSMSIAKQFALEHNVTVVLKNYRTLIVTPKGEIFQNTTGNAALAKGGSGDVLAGMIASLIAQGISCKDAALAAIYIHGYCADRLVQRMSQYSVLARDLIEEIPFALKEVVL
ncbi:MAG: NAD(P)H-hydrate dehydratase, partial [Oscillospiraceae bacterium]